jgi:glycosyltransferase involved in cell wall biosynthesis
VTDAAQSRPLRVLHVSPSDTGGGAEKGAYAVHRALRAAGVESIMLVLRKYSSDATVVTRGWADDAIFNGLRDHLDRLPLRFYRRRPDHWWTVGWLSADLTRAVARLQPDVVHLHWTGRGLAPVSALSRLRRFPIVWTMRDMWPLTGGCHYTNGCERFLEGCGHCPQLGSRRAADLSSWQWRRKLRAWRDVGIHFVALSNWMADYARRSPLLSSSEVSVIPTGIDVETFKPVDRAVARKLWNVPGDRQIVMYGALHSTVDPRKGFAYLRGALRALSAQGWGERAMVLVFGSEDGPRDLGLDVRYMGVVHDAITLATLYSAADVMVVPSVQENLGKTVLEAMACGVPVVGFANTGQLDTITHQVDGYLARDLCADDLAAGIAWCLDRARVDDALSRNARETVLRRFDIRRVVEQHVRLYRDVVGKKRASAVVVEPPGFAKGRGITPSYQERGAS